MRRGLRSFVLVAVGALSVVSAVCPPPAAAADDVSAPSSACRESTALEAEAVDLAAACGADVEVTSSRTEWDTLYAQPDGTMRWDASATAVRTLLDDQWAPVDNTLVASGSGFEVAAPVTAMTFSDGAPGIPLVSLQRDGHSMTFDVSLDLPAPTVDGPRLTYTDVLPGVDLLVTVNADATGFSEVLRVEDAHAAADPRLAELTFPVTTTSDLDLEGAGGGFVALDGAGERVFSSPTPAMWDSTQATTRTAQPLALLGLGRVGAQLATVGPTPVAAEAPAAGGDRAVAPIGGENVAWMPAKVSTDAVTITPDAQLLADPETTWPVYIDPSISGSRNMWTAVRDVFGQDYGFDPDQGVGLCSRATTTSCSATFKSRLLWTFTGLGEIGALTSNQIVSATFAAVGTNAYDCTPRPVTLYRVGDFNSSTPWPGGTLWEAMSTVTFVAKSSCAGQPVRWIEFDATAQARAIADANTAQGSLGLAVDESSMAYWKRFRNDATFSITYNRPPSTPTGLSLTVGAAVKSCGSWINSRTPTLSATVDDPDGGNLQAYFDVFSTSGAVYTPGLTTAKAAGSVHTQAVPSGSLSDGDGYQFRVVALDSGGLLGGASFCQFGIDTVAPVAPVIAPATATSYPVKYVEGAWAGGLHQVGGFAVSAGTSTDVLSYKYSFNNTALSSSVSGSAATLTFSPDQVGPQTLRVQAVDRAGNVSPVSLYTFNVDFPVTSAQWSLDEGSGTVARSSVAADGSPLLNLAGATSWVDGPLVPFGAVDDRALHFGALADRAVTAGPVVSTAGSFAVLATVRLDSLPAATATAVGQDGRDFSGFELGYRADATCAGGMSSCWYFSMRTADTAGGAVQVASPAATVAGEWVSLVAMHDASTGLVELSVCTPFGDPTPSALVTAPYASTWRASGPLRVGGALSAGAPVAAWPGDVADVQLLAGTVDESAIRRACSPAASGTAGTE
ncbi:hypothetical protein GCM10022273_16370 [Cellulomonas soli]